MKPVEIEKNLKKYLPKGTSALEKAMRYSVLSGGKRVRPLLAIEAAGLCGGKIKDIIPVACAIEFVHAYSLIHDDLPAMDDDDFRRGKPTCHKVFGEASAILAGDALLTLAFNVIAKNTGSRAGLNIIKELSDAIGVNGMAGGQAMDLESKNRVKNRSMSREINKLKTARLFEASAKIGAISAGAAKEKINALQRFGLFLGLSFQLIDDYLDGETSCRKEARLFIEKAKKELKIFGKRADTLRKNAELLLSRKK